MGLIRTAPGFRIRRVGLALCLRICCVLLLGTAYLSVHGDYRVHGLSSVSRGLRDAAASEGAGHLLSYDTSQIENDVILPDRRGNDPFLALRNAIIPFPCPFLKSASLLSEIWVGRIRVLPPDAGPPHLYMLAKSAQLLC